MQSWRLGILGIETIPPWLGELEIEQFFRLTPLDITTIKTLRGTDSQLGLSLHIGFLRMSGRVLNLTDFSIGESSLFSVRSWRFLHHASPCSGLCIQCQDRQPRR